MKLKVCGMRDAANIHELMELEPDFMGMIFYPKSTRYVETMPEVNISVRKVGVFVNEEVAEVIKKSEEFGLDMVQLHGSESVDMVNELKESGLEVIKVFSVSDHLPLEQMEPYVEWVDYFLFDTKTPLYGGSGEKFDWSILNSYNLEKPFFLSGGIDLEDLKEIKLLNIPELYAVDINSRFEIEPAYKDIEKIRAFKRQL